MDRYKYSIELSYKKQKENRLQKIRPEHIKSIIIDRDYLNNNLPVIFMNIILDKRLIDDMIKNYTKNTMVLTIYKYVYIEGKLTTKTKYIHKEMMYFLTDDLNYRQSVDYADKENEQREDIYKTIAIGLMSIDCINNNKKTFNTILRNSSMINAVHTCTSHVDMVIERFDYNRIHKELIIPPQSSTASVIKYLNDISVFYKTPYRFFIDFDCGYLLSSSGTGVPKKAESINSVIITVRDPLHHNAMNEGMITNYNTKNYQVDVSAADTILAENKVTEKVYTSVSSISESGLTKAKNLHINQSKYSNNKTEIIRTPSSNPNLIENISAATEQTSSHFSMNKMDVDLSIFTPNKRYLIKNFDGHDDRDGDFILVRKRDLFYFESNDMFAANVMLEFDQVVKKK